MIIDKRFSKIRLNTLDTVMSDNNNSNNKNKYSISTGATALISVLAVPVTLLASLLISNKKKK